MELWKEKSNDKKRLFFTLQLTQNVKVTFKVTRSHDILYDLKVMWTIEISLTNLWLNPTYTKRDIRNWKHNEVMFARPKVT